MGSSCRWSQIVSAERIIVTGLLYALRICRHLQVQRMYLNDIAIDK